MLNGQLQNLFKGIYGVLATDRVALKVPDVVVCGKEDLDNILLSWMLVLDFDGTMESQAGDANRHQDLSSEENQSRQCRPSVWGGRGRLMTSRVASGNVDGSRS